MRSASAASSGRVRRYRCQASARAPILALSSAISLCISCKLEALAGQRIGELGVEPLLGLGDLLGNGGAVRRPSRRRWPVSARGLERGFELADAVGKLGKLGRGLVDAGLQGFDLGLELRQALRHRPRRAARSRAWRCAASSAAMSGCGPLDPCRPPRPPQARASATTPTRPPSSARGKVGDEALQLRQARCAGGERRIAAMRAVRRRYRARSARLAASGSRAASPPAARLRP